MLVRVSSGNWTLEKCLKNADRMRWVFAWRGYMTQLLLSVQKHFSLKADSHIACRAHAAPLPIMPCPS